MTQKKKWKHFTLQNNVLFPLKRANHINSLSLSIHDIHYSCCSCLCLWLNISRREAEQQYALCSFRFIHKLQVQTEESHTTNNRTAKRTRKKERLEHQIHLYSLGLSFFLFPFVYMVGGCWLISFVRSTTRDVGSNGRSSHSVSIIQEIHACFSSIWWFCVLFCFVLF